MSVRPVELVASAVTCPVGLVPAEAIAAVQGRLAAFAAGPFMGPRLEPYVTARLPDEALPAGTAATDWNGRLAGLLARTLADAALLAPGPARAPLPLLLALPERHDGVAADAEALRAAAVAAAGGRLDPAQLHTGWQGRAGGLLALGAAIGWVAAGTVDEVLVAAVDSHEDDTLLDALHDAGRVKSSRNLDGFIPGESAVALRVRARPPGAAPPADGAPPAIMLSPVAHGEEPGHLYADAPYRGEGLAGVVASLLAAVPPRRPVGTVWSSMTGEHHWAKEWGVAFLRSRAAFDPAHQVMHPADCVGDTGAAAGLLLVALAAEAMRAAPAAAPALVYASADRGARAALLLDTLPGR